MNGALTLATILSVVLAISGSGSGDSANQKKTDPEQTVETSKDKTSCTIWGSLTGVSVNHNEKLMRDAQSKPPVGSGCSPWVCGANHNETLVQDVQFKPIRTQCSPLVCGSNHNETLMRDAASESNEWNLEVSSEQPSGEARLLFTLLSYHSGFGCSPWICGSNHNETLLRDPTLDRAPHSVESND